MPKEKKISDGKTEVLYPPFSVKEIERPTIKVVYEVGKKSEIKKVQKL